MGKIWCEVDKKIIMNNIKNIKENIPDKKFIAVLKANAYGLGIEGISEAIDNHIDMYAISSTEEYEKIRSEKDVLLMSPLCSIEDFEYARGKDNLVLSIDNIDMLKNIDKNWTYRVHICVDTSNHRVGVKAKHIDLLIAEIESGYKNVTIEGVYTHFHNCSNIKETTEQIDSFKGVYEWYKDKGYLFHCIASNVAINKELTRLCDFTNAFRIGNLLYGMAGNNLGYQKTYNFYSKVMQKHTIKKGEKIGFGASYHEANKDSLVGIISAGHSYGVGCVRESVDNPIKAFAKAVKYSKKGITYVKDISMNKQIDIIGNVNMNSLIIDITDMENIDIVKINLSPILADSAIEKRYI